MQWDGQEYEAEGISVGIDIEYQDAQLHSTRHYFYLTGLFATLWLSDSDSRWQDNSDIVSLINAKGGILSILDDEAHHVLCL